MPRGRKKKYYTLEEQMTNALNEKARLEQDLKEVKAEIIKLEQQQEEEERNKIVNAILKSGKSMDDVMAWLNE